MKKHFLLILIIISTINLQAQQSFYVDGINGNDGNNGISLATAWKTIQQSFNAAKPGSVVYIKGGIYNTQLVLNVSGTPGHPIEFTNYQNDSVYIDGTGLSANPMIDIYDKSNIIIRNLIIQNLVANYGVGLQAVASTSGLSQNLTFEHLIIRNISWTASALAIPNSSNNTVPLGIYGEGSTAANVMSNVLVDSCEIYNNITGFSENLTINGYVDGVVVSNNIVHDNTNIGIDFTGNYGWSPTPLLDQVRNGVAVGNICYNNLSNVATSAGIYVDGATDILIERNICHHNGYGIEVGCEENGTASNITVRDNLIYDNQEKGMAIGGWTTSTTGQVLNSSITNNTFVANNYANDGGGEIDVSKASDCIFKNNIFYTNAQNILMYIEPIVPQAANVFDYDCWYTPNNDSNNIYVNWHNTSLSTFQQYKAVSGFDAHSFYGNPLLVNASIAFPDFHLQNNSPCINAGDPSYVPALGETDFAGNVRAIRIIDIGAYEVPGILYAIGDICPGGGTLLISNLTGNSYQWQINTGSGFVDIDSTNPEFLGVYKDTLTLTNVISTNNYGNQFRCVVDSNYSNLYMLRFIDYWVGNVSTAWENPLNWSCSILPDSNTDVIINAGTVLLSSNQSVRSISISNAASFTARPSSNLHVLH